MKKNYMTKEYRRDYYHRNKAKMLESMKKYRNKNWNKLKKRQYERNQEVKFRVFSYYGGDPPKCNCCGEDSVVFLTIDHIEGGGKEHRKQINFRHFYRWLIRNNFPKGFQVLCRNCNWAKSRGGCPHKKPKRLNKTKINSISEENAK